MLSIRGQALGGRLPAQCSASHSLQPCAEGWGRGTQLCASNQHCLGRGESSSTKAPHWYLGFLSPNINNMRLSEDLAVTRVQKSSPELLNSAASCVLLVPRSTLGWHSDLCLLVVLSRAKHWVDGARWPTGFGLSHQGITS